MTLKRHPVTMLTAEAPGARAQTCSEGAAVAATVPSDCRSPAIAATVPHPGDVFAPSPLPYRQYARAAR
jgi:hypothetical protein